MGVAFVMSPCLVCRTPFVYNPHKVPSHPAFNGKPLLPGDPLLPMARREPICGPCVEVINAERRARGLPEWPVAPDAYEPVDEGEL